MELHIATLDDMHYIAILLKESMLRYNIRYLLCSGEYGVGKTTLIRYIVQALPYTEAIEVSSPSFTIYNIYPTIPPCIHIDLYNTQYSLNTIIEELEEIEEPLVFAEWVEHSPALGKEASIACTLAYADDSSRILFCSSYNVATNVAEEIAYAYQAYKKNE